MLGILITESAEVLYSLIKLTFDAGRGAYYWYYVEEQPEKKKIHESGTTHVNLSKPSSNKFELNPSKYKF